MNVPPIVFSTFTKSNSDQQEHFLIQYSCLNTISLRALINHETQNCPHQTYSLMHPIINKSLSEKTSLFSQKFADKNHGINKSIRNCRLLRPIVFPRLKIFPLVMAILVIECSTSTGLNRTCKNRSEPFGPVTSCSNDVFHNSAEKFLHK